MVMAMTAFLWLGIAAISSAELAAGGKQYSNDHRVVGLLVQQAVQLKQQSHQLQNLQDRVEALETSQENTVAQLTGLTQTVAKQAKSTSFRGVLLKLDVVANTPIRFDQEFATGGRMYDPNTGIYTVDTPGVYSFGFQLFPQFLADILIDMYINNTIRIRARCYNSNTYPTSCASSTFFPLKKGDKVWVQSNRAGKFHPNVHSFFTGALISPDA